MCLACLKNPSLSIPSLNVLVSKSKASKSLFNVNLILIKWVKLRVDRIKPLSFTIVGVF